MAEYRVLNWCKIDGKSNYFDLVVDAKIKVKCYFVKRLSKIKYGKMLI